MSSITLLNEDLLKLIYAHLKLRDRLTFSLTNKKFHHIFYNYPLSDIVFNVDHNNVHLTKAFLFKNIINIRVKSAQVDYDYLEKFDNLRHLDLSQVEFTSFKNVQNLLNHLPRSMTVVTVMDNDVKELFNVAKSFYKRKFSLTILINKKRPLEGPIITSTSKRVSTPPRVYEETDDKIEACFLYRSRLKFANNSPRDFIPEIILQKFPILRSVQYRSMINESPLAKNFMGTTSVSKVEDAANILKGLLIHSVVQTQTNNWILVTQVEVYYHDKKIDDVAQVNLNDKCSEVLTVQLSKLQEFSSSRYELCFWCGKFEIVANGEYFNDEQNVDKARAFLGVTMPTFVGKDTFPILFSPGVPAETSSCVRMLRNYKKTASLRKWCFKSSFFLNLKFTTPDQLTLYRTEPDSFLLVCSKFLYLAIFNQLNEEEYASLESTLDKLKYWENLGFAEKQSKKTILESLKQATKGKSRSLSKPKKLLVEVVLKKKIPK